LTPNLLARTIETVEGGGMIVLLLKSVNSLKQLYAMTMDVHARYRTEAHTDVVARFNERFILSLMKCRGCIVLDDELNILPLSSHVAELKPVVQKARDAKNPELQQLQESLQDTQPVGVLINLCRTLDQVRFLSLYSPLLDFLLAYFL
jgi:N-acetyltransferase 10